MSINHESMIVYGCRLKDYKPNGCGDVYFHDGVDVYHLEDDILGFEVCFDGGCTLMELVDSATLHHGLFRGSGYNGELKFFLVEIVY